MDQSELTGKKTLADLLNGLLTVLSDPKWQATWGYAIVGYFVASHMEKFADTHAAALEIWRNYLFSVGGVVGIGSIGHAYKQGKAVEGTIPDGRTSKTAQVTQFVNAPEAERIAAYSAPQDQPMQPNYPQSNVPNQQPDPSNQPHYPMRAKLPNILIAAVMILCLGNRGCGGAGTSPLFQKTGADIAGEISGTYRNYVNQDQSISPAEKQSRLFDGEALAASVKTQKLINVDTVSAAWQRVKPNYIAYVNADATADKEILLQSGQFLDDLIAQEQQRRANWHAGKQAPAPSPAVSPVSPATLPAAMRSR